MAATKTSKTILASSTITAGTPTNGTEWNASTAYGGIVFAKITNGGTGPTVGCDFVVYLGESTGTKREFSRQTAPTTNSAVQEFAVEIPPGAMFINVTFTGNTAQNVTAECYAEELSTV